LLVLVCGLVVVVVEEEEECCLGSQLACATCLDDLLLGGLGEELCAHNNGDGRQAALAEHLEEASLVAVNDWGLAGLRGGALEDVLGHQSPQLVHVHGGAVVPVVQLVPVTHANLAKVARVVLVKVNAVVVLATSVTTATGVRSVLADTSVTG